MSDFKVTELATNLDFDNLAYWDVVIIGAGPGGLAASLTTAHRGLTTLVIEAKATAGGQPEFLYAESASLTSLDSPTESPDMIYPSERIAKP